MKVADVMTCHVEFIEPDATAQDAAALMGELDVRALPIGSPEDLKGIITDWDLLYRVGGRGQGSSAHPRLGLGHDARFHLPAGRSTHDGDGPYGLAQHPPAARTGER